MASLKSLPNLLTGARIVLAVLVFALLAWARLRPSWTAPLALIAFAAFAVGSVTDYFDGWLARKLDARSAWGTALDPIADKIAVLAAILGLVLVRPRIALAAPGFLILFREVFVSGLREAGAGLAITLPVTRLAKWKTTIQLVSFCVALLGLGLTSRPLMETGDALLWLSAAITLWTGAQYARAFDRAARGG